MIGVAQLGEFGSHIAAFLNNDSPNGAVTLQTALASLGLKLLG